MAGWDDVVPEMDRLIYEKAGYCKQGILGKRPALLVVDVTYAFVGDKPEPILESIKRFSNSCGEAGWKAIAEIKKLLELARSQPIPVFYSHGERGSAKDYGRWANKNRRSLEGSAASRDFSSRIVDEIKPREEDVIIRKRKASAFFATPLICHLIDFQIDTLLICGTATSGCVRATVVDAFSYDLYVGIIEEATFDRSPVSHQVSLFEMNAKYANVMNMNETKAYLDSLQGAH